MAQTAESAEVQALVPIASIMLVAPFLHSESETLVQSGSAADFKPVFKSGIVICNLVVVLHCPLDIVVHF